eukprot:scaffold5710_cov64-Phaeocystis_antarctica.AAC.1
MDTFNASIAVLLPLLYSGQGRPEYSNLSRPGASFVCTLKLALQHVNTRNTSVVPELAKLTANFSMSSKIVDTDSGASGNSAVAVDYLMDYFFRLRDQPNRQVSAVLGPASSS